jgi:hypothetical protein
LIVSGKVGVGTKTPAAVLEVNGTAKFDGLVSFASGQTFPGGGTGTITGITTTSPLTGSGTSGSVALSLNTSALETTLNGKYAQLGAADTFTTAATFSGGLTGDMSKGSGYSAVTGLGTNGSTGLTGISDTGFGVVGTASAAPVGSAGVLGTTGTTFSATYTDFAPSYSAGIWADKSDAAYGPALFATADDEPGAFVLNNSEYSIALDAENYAGPAAYFGAEGASGVGIEVRANNDNAGSFQNSSNSEPTLNVYNAGAGGLGTAVKGTGSTGLFDTLTATSATGTCGIGGGSMSCTGPMKSLVSTGGGSRTVETYAMQSPESWMEDFGTGSMERGTGVVQIDPAFAETVTADASYHVFLTPRGDSPGHLYVTNVTANSFEVREANGGTSSISFDYRIVAKRRGYEAKRLTDVTDAFHRETERAAKNRLDHATRPGMGPGMKQHRASVSGPTPGSVLPQAKTVSAR